MIIKIHMKTPDCCYDAIDETLTPLERSPDDKEALGEEWDDLLKRWFRYGECCTIRVDTEKGTATVEEVRG